MIVDASTRLLVLFTFEHVPDGKSVAWFGCLKKKKKILTSGIKLGSVLHVLLAQGSGAVCSDPRSLSLPPALCEWCVVISLIPPFHHGVGIDGSTAKCAFSV